MSGYVAGVPGHQLSTFGVMLALFGVDMSPSTIRQLVNLLQQRIISYGTFDESWKHVCRQ